MEDKLLELATVIEGNKDAPSHEFNTVKSSRLPEIKENFKKKGFGKKTKQNSDQEKEEMDQYLAIIRLKKGEKKLKKIRPLH